MIELESAPAEWLGGWLHVDAALLTALALLLLALGAAISWWLRSLIGRWRRGRRLAHASRAELAAAELLERAGYRVLGYQVDRNWPVIVNGRNVTIRLRVDYLVARRGVLYVADAKTGELAISIHHAATRRQLLEYLIAYGAHGALLVDMETRRIQEVRFPELAAPAPLHRVR
jgi:hypothetical protein